MIRSDPNEQSSTLTPPNSTPRVAPPRSVAPTERRPGARSLDKPGCQIADTCLVIHGYLEELAEGNGGFGVLKLGKERLEEAVLIARAIGKESLADNMAEVAEKLPSVRTAEAAEELVSEMDDIKKQAWRLGRACGLAHK